MSLFVDPHHAQKGAAKLPRVLIDEIFGCDHRLRRPGHRAVEAAQPIPVVADSQAATALDGQLVELPEGEGQQGKGVFGLGVGEEGLDQTRLDVKACEGGGLLDDVAQSLDRHRSHRHAAEAHS